MRSCGGSVVTSSPKKRTVPDVGGKSPVTQLSSVVLPAPFDPSTARRSPGRTLSVISVSAASAPNIRLTPRNSIALPVPAAAIRSAIELNCRSCRRCGMRARTTSAATGRSRRPGENRTMTQEAETDQRLEAPPVETDGDQRVKREGAQNHVDDCADKRADRVAEPADDGDDEKIDGGFDAGRARAKSDC